MYTSALNLVCGVIEPGSASTCPRSTSSFSTPRSSTPMLSPATPSSSSLRNISTPVTTFFAVGGEGRSSISRPAPPAARRLADHLPAVDPFLRGGRKADDFDFLADLHLAALDAAGHDGSAA